MLLKKYKIFIIALVILTVAVFVISPIFAAPTVKNPEMIEGSETLMGRLRETATGQEGAGYAGASETTLSTIIGTVIKTFLGFLGVIFVCLIIYAGYLWMTAAGNEDEIKKAKDMILAAVIGLIITLSAFAITGFVMGKISPK